MRFLLPLFLMTAAACLPAPHDVLGKSCDADSDCGAPYVCQAKRCANEPGQGELPVRCRTNLAEAAFETGVGKFESNSSATAIETTTLVSRSAPAGLRVYGFDNSSSRLTARHSAVPATGPNKTYCAAAWIKRGTLRAELSFVARRYEPGGNWEDDAFTGSPSRFAPTTDEWTRYVTRITTTAAYQHSVNFRLSNDNPFGIEYFIDDVRIWEDPNNDCLAAVDEGCAP